MTRLPIVSGSRTRMEYLPARSMVVTLGADIFAGPVETLYGQFHSNDRAYFDVSWRF